MIKGTYQQDYQLTEQKRKNKQKKNKQKRKP